MIRAHHQRGFYNCRGIAASFFVAITLITILFPAIAQGQEGIVEIRMDQPEDIGLYGRVRVGTWAPMRVSVYNHTGQIHTVNVEWIMPDVDGDDAILQRTPVVLAPNATTKSWLYAVPTVGNDVKAGWIVRCVHAETGESLATTRVAPIEAIPSRTGVVGITGTGGGLVGLGPYRQAIIQHEEIITLNSLIPKEMPDRWQGLSLLDMLVWTKQGGDPAEASEGVRRAIRDWVWRGGHLVVTLSSIDSAWTGEDAKFADMLPPVKFVPADVPTPKWLYPPDMAQFLVNTSFRAITFEPLTQLNDEANPRRDVRIIQPDPSRPAAPLIAASSYGFGRVTLIGMDLTDLRFNSPGYLKDFGLPALWTAVTGWQSPGTLPEGLLPYKDMVEQSLVVSPISRNRRELSRFMPGEVAMKQTAATTMFAAILLFGVYWLMAGPVMFSFLKSRGMLRHSWLVFGGIVVIFSALSWFGAMLMRPGQINTTHFTVVDIDSTQSRSGNIRTQSWFSVFVPKHGNMSIELAASADDDVHNAQMNLLASPGMSGSEKGSFSGTQNYTVNAVAPASIPSVPMRSTAKQFQAHYTNTLVGSPLEEAWQSPTGTITLSPSSFRGKKVDLPAGLLTHNLPAALNNITMYYCPGEGHAVDAYVWFSGLEWSPGAPFRIDPPARKDGLVIPPLFKANVRIKNKAITIRKKKLTGYENRSLDREGYLGGVLRRDADTPYEAINAMSFFNYLPPPDFVESTEDNALLEKIPTHFTRAVGRTLDLSHMVPMRRLIIIGHMREKAPLPLPLRVDGEEVQSDGWTVVRFILPVPDPSP